MQKDGQPTISLSVEIVPTVIVVTSTATAKVTEIVHETVVEVSAIPSQVRFPASGGEANTFTLAGNCRAKLYL